MNKLDNQNFLKIQTCVLKVNIHCDGCKKEVKKLLQKIDGVYTISIDSEGKVAVSGSADPSTLIKKLNKAGKHAELLAPKGGGNNNKKNNFLHDELLKVKLDGGKGLQKDNGKSQKSGGSSSGGAGGKDQKGQQLFKDLKLPQLKGLNFPSQKEEQKNVKFSLPEGVYDGRDFDDDDDDDDDFDDYDDDDFDDLDDEDDFDDDLKPINKKPMSNKKGGGDSGGNNDKKSGGNNGGKKGGDKPKDGKNGGEKDTGMNSKKWGEKNEAQPKIMGEGFSGLDMGKMNGPMGGDIPQGAAVQGMAAANPYHHQQYMAMMRQQQQPQMMMNGPTVYGQPMGYMPAPPVYGEPYANYYNDENTNSSCSIL